MTKVPEIEIVDLDNSTTSGEIRVKKDFDVDAKLNELEKTNDHLKDWSRAN